MNPERQLEQHFAATFGRAPEGLWAAPGRVNLIGEYTDLNEGFVLPFATPQATRVLAGGREDRCLSVRSLQDRDGGRLDMDLDNPEMPVGWSAYPLAVARAIELYGYGVKGADLLIESDVPVGAGLSSSAALECSVALALCALSGIDLPPMAVALIAQRAENQFVGVPSGIMDQAASMCCTAGNALLLDTRALQARQVPFDPEAAGLSLVVVDTRVKHGLAESAYGERRKSCEDAARALGVRALRDVPLDKSEEALARLSERGSEVLVRRARHVLTEEARVLAVVEHLDAGDLSGLGQLLLAGHRSARDDFEISSPELDTVVEVAMASGALGARLTGAGFGGSAIALIASELAGAFEAEVTEQFAAKGFAGPACFLAAPSAGARRER
ncbi:MAG TPA: galactokinase [Acidimicrobiales bacterium]|nr:galactokinase [Acidimicrobiales bacterium]